jgi:predicted ATPase/DNA-binding SARP family transcriptional activator
VEFRVLGALEVVAGGAPVTLRPGRQQQLLAALLLSPNRTVSNDRLSEAIWEHEIPTSAASLLRLYVSQLRRALPEPCLETRPGGYAVRVAEGALDAARFEQLVAGGRAALAGDTASLAAELLGEALSLWRGPGFAGMRGDAFEDESRRLAELRLACLEEWFECELSLGRHAEALSALSTHVAAEPLRERARGQLMLALYRAGRQADALACYRDGHRLLDERLGIVPSAELRELERAILRHEPLLSLPAVASSDGAAALRLPAPGTRTVGREREIAEISELLTGSDVRLVTLVGPGGIGKSRLALESAHAVRESFPGGAAFVALADEPDVRRVLPLIARAVGLRELPEGGEIDVLSSHLRDQDPLVVLDNLEHLMGCAPAVSDLLAAAPGLRIVATSRSALRIAGERVFPVPPLSHGSTAELFLQLTEAEGLPGSLDGRDLAAIDEVCELLDGLPLAVELAAPWLRVLSPEALLGRLATRLPLLEGGRRDLPERQRTLRATMDWSYQLLDDPARALFAELGVFEGGFDLEAVEDVCLDRAALATLTELLDASLVSREGDRYRLLDTIREYALERLGGDAGPHDRHASHFSRLADTAEPELGGREQARWLAHLEREHGNLRAALSHFRSRAEPVRELHLAATLARFWYLRGYLELGGESLAQAIDAAGAQGEPADRAKALRTSSAIAVLRGRYADARRYAERGLSAYRELGDTAGVARSLSNLGAILHAQGELGEAAATLDESIALCGPADDRVRALALNNRGDVALSAHDWQTAERCFAESLALLEAAGDTANVARALYNLAAVELGRQRFDAAAPLLARSLRHACDVDDREDMAWSLLGLASVDAEHGRVDSGRRLLVTAEGLLRDMGASMKPFEAELHRRTRRALDAGGGASRTPAAPLSPSAVAELAAVLRG